MSLTDELLAKLQGAPLQQVSQQLGISDTQASGAISAALPVCVRCSWVWKQRTKKVFARPASCKIYCCQ